MKKFDVQIALEGIAEAKGSWAKAIREFNADVEKVLVRLLHEASANYMSPEEVARYSGIPVKRVRALMREYGLNPRDGKRVLADTAAKALAENAELLGIPVHEMDLMSPLAYLPAGSLLRQQITDKTVSKVTELPDEVSGNALDALDRLLDQVIHTAGTDAGLIRAGEDYRTVLAAIKSASESGYESIGEAVHDLHLRSGRLRQWAVCPTCRLSGDRAAE